MDPETTPALLDFITKTLTGLGQAGPDAISAERALVSAQQYPFLRDQLHENNDRLAQAYIKNETSFRTTVREIFNESHTLLRSQLTSLQKQTADGPLPEPEISQRSVYLQEARAAQKELLTPQLQDLDAKKKTFARDLVQNWTKQLHQNRLKDFLQDNTELVERSLTNSLLQLKPESQPELAKEFLARTVLHDLEHYPEVREAGAEESETMQRVLVASPLGAELIDKQGRLTLWQSRTAETVLSNLNEVVRPDHLTKILLTDTNNLTANFGQKSLEALKLTRFSQALDQRLFPGEDPTASGRVFQSLAQTSFQKIVAPAADWMLSRFPQATREAIVDTLLVNSWSMTVESLEQRFGASIVNSPLFQHWSQLVINTKTVQASNPLVGLGRVAGDAFNTVFKGPNEVALAQFEAFRKSGGKVLEIKTPLTRSAWLNSAVYAASPTLILTRLLGPLKKPEAARGAAAPSLGLGGLDKLFAGLGSGVSGLFRNAQSSVGGFFGSLTRSNRRSGGAPPIPLLGWLNPASWFNDLALVLALVVVGTLIIMFIFPFFTNLLQTIQAVRKASLLVGIVRTINGCVNTNDPACQVTPCDPAKQDCRWPTTGSITQGPYSKSPNNLITCLHTTHANDNAVDFGASLGTPVYAVTNGHILTGDKAPYAGCTDGTGCIDDPKKNPNCGCGGLAGNHIWFQADSGYTLLYGHLSQATVTKWGDGGQTVKAGTEIAKTDQTGSSSGPHLHFGYYGSGSVLSILPKTPDGTLGCVNGVLGCRACPYVVTGGQ